jgi:hypothetical protein
MTSPSAHSSTDPCLNLIITFLTPLFLTTTGGDITSARAAALQAVNTHVARDPTDLFPIAQVIAFGLVSLDSLGRSLNESLSTALILRLRGNAVSLNRAAEQSRKTLLAPLPDPIAEPPDPEAEHLREQALMAGLARTEQRLKEARAIVPPAEPSSATHQVTPRNARQPVAAAPQPNRSAPEAMAATASRTAWASAMNHVAREFTQGLANLPPAQRRQATLRATALNSVAQHLLTG